MVPKRKQSKFPVTDGWVKKLWYVHVMEYESSMKGNEILTLVTTRMNLENIVIKERSQTHRYIPCVIPSPWNAQRGQIHKDTG
jgi:hypothetical protein